MRTTKNIFPQLADPAAIESAARSSAQGKRRRPDVAWFLFRFEAECARLASALRAGTWAPGPFVPYRIRDPKPRVIARATFADRVVHLAVARLIERVALRSRVDGVFACLPGLGAHRAVLRIAEHQHRHHFALHLDVRAYFPSIDLVRVRALLDRRIRDAAFMNVVDRILDSGRGFYADPEVRAFSRLPPDWPPPDRGLPIGASTSQVIAAHLYLDALDHYVKRTLKIPGYVRYVDDLFLFADSRAQLREARAAIGAWLDSERGLRLKHPQARVLSCRGTMVALGHAVRRNSIEALPRARMRFRKRIRATWRDPRADLDAWSRSAASSVGVQMFGLLWERPAWTPPANGQPRPAPDAPRRMHDPHAAGSGGSE